MDKASLLGLGIAFAALAIGIVLKGVALTKLLVPAAFLIIFGGTAGAVIIAFPMNEVKVFPKLLGIIMKEQKIPKLEDLIPIFVDWANVARRDGLLALEGKVSEIDDEFLRNGLGLAIDGQTQQFIRDVMHEELAAMEQRHQGNALIFTQAGTYAPTLGVLGAVVGLIAALANMNDIDALGAAIGAAFVATLLGIFMGYVIALPMANKLKRKSKQEVQVRTIMIEGVLSILEGQAPRAIEQKLASYLSLTERKKVIKTEEK